MSDPKDKWKQPEQPPSPLFTGQKERDLVKQVNDELIERVIGQCTDGFERNLIASVSPIVFLRGQSSSELKTMVVIS